ncbi:MAG: type II secretion system F family protein [Acidobacteria bacterium]|nr:type II secretion system F family protein [Acidobacteriota bacterium]
MPNFKFTGRNRQGETVSGERVADNKNALSLALRREQIFLMDAEEKKAGGGFSFEFGGNPTPKDVAIFTRQFSVMIDSGVPLVQCLQILSETQENKKFAAAIQGVTREVESGTNLAQSMKQFPKVFDDLYTNMVAAGEAGGILDTIFQRLSVYIEKAVKLKGAVKSALVFPAIVVVVASGVIALILRYVVPAFTELFESMNVDMPLPTRVVIGASRFVGSYGFFILVGLGLIGFALRSYYGTPKGRYNVDALLLKAPIFGPLLRKIAVARFTRTMSTLIASGVPILDGLTITAVTSGNAIIEEAIMKVKSAIEEGRTIVEPLKESGVFPTMVTSMIGVGEAAGALETMLSKIADFYEEEVDTAVGDLMTALEPLMMVLLGVIVGGIVISMYMPIFSLVGQLSGK